MRAGHAYAWLAFFEGEKVKKIQKRYPILAAIILLFAGYFGWYENDQSQDNLFGQAIQSSQASQSAKSTLTFRSDSLCEEHFEKHGIEMGFTSAKEYEKAAAAVVSDSRALHKLEKEDGDDVYYLKDTNEFVIVSTDGYIRTYFYPRDGIEYFERQ